MVGVAARAGRCATPLSCAVPRVLHYGWDLLNLIRFNEYTVLPNGCGTGAPSRG